MSSHPLTIAKSSKNLNLLRRNVPITRQLILLHGKEGSSQGFKANYLRQIFPDIITPDFNGSLENRLEQLAPIVGDQSGWTIIGSSMGGLMATLFTCEHPHQVDKLILLAPALVWSEFAGHIPSAVEVPTVIYHGQWDTVIPLKPVKALAAKVFTNLTFHTVDDDHMLQATMPKIDWQSLVA